MTETDGLGISVFSAALNRHSPADVFPPGRFVQDRAATAEAGQMKCVFRALEMSVNTVSGMRAAHAVGAYGGDIERIAGI